MSNPTRLSIVIPCLDELEAIPQVLGKIEMSRIELKSVGIDEIETIVIDDGSTDGSSELLRSTPQITVISNHICTGYGHSLKKGFREATGDYIAFLDMDDTYDPRYLSGMIKVIKSHEADIVSGDRLSLRTDMPIVRKIGNYFFVSLIEFLFRQKVRDSTSGLRVFKAALRNEFCDLSTDELDYSLAMTLHCLSRKIPFHEMPIGYSKRIGESKLLVFKEGPRFLSSILKAWMRFLVGARASEGVSF